MLGIIFIILLVLVVVGIPTIIDIAGDRPKSLDYNKRWSDKEYIKMVHKTRELESGMGIYLSECLCDRHKPEPKPLPARQPVPVKVNNYNGPVVRLNVLPEQMKEIYKHGWNGLKPVQAVYEPMLNYYQVIFASPRPPMIGWSEDINAKPIYEIQTPTFGRSDGIVVKPYKKAPTIGYERGYK